MSFSADKVPILKAGSGHGQRRFSSSKEPSGNGEYEPIDVRGGLEALEELLERVQSPSVQKKKVEITGTRA